MNTSISLTFFVLCVIVVCWAGAYMLAKLEDFIFDGKSQVFGTMMAGVGVFYLLGLLSGWWSV